MFHNRNLCHISCDMNTLTNLLFNQFSCTNSKNPPTSFHFIKPSRKPVTYTLGY